MPSQSSIISQCQSELLASSYEYERMLSPILPRVWNAITHRIKSSLCTGVGVTIIPLFKFFIRDCTTFYFFVADSFIRKSCRNKVSFKKPPATILDCTGGSRRAKHVEVGVSRIASDARLDVTSTSAALDYLCSFLGRTCISTHSSYQLPISGVGNFVISPNQLNFKFNPSFKINQSYLPSTNPITSSKSEYKTQQLVNSKLLRQKMQKLKMQERQKDRIGDKQEVVPLVSVTTTTPPAAAVETQQQYVETTSSPKQKKPKKRIMKQKEEEMGGGGSVLPVFLSTSKPLVFTRNANQDAVLTQAYSRDLQRFQKQKTSEEKLSSDLAARASLGTKRYWKNHVTHCRHQVELYEDLNTQVRHKNERDAIDARTRKEFKIKTSSSGLNAFPMEPLRILKQNKARLKAGLDSQLRASAHHVAQSNVVSLAQDSYYVEQARASFDADKKEEDRVRHEKRRVLTQDRMREDRHQNIKK